MSERITAGTFVNNCLLHKETGFKASKYISPTIILEYSLTVLDCEEKPKPPKKLLIPQDIEKMVNAKCGSCPFNIVNGGNCKPSKPRSLGTNAYRVNAALVDCLKDYDK